MIAIAKSLKSTLDVDGVLNNNCRICLPRVYELIPMTLVETHGSSYSILLGVTKMYGDLKRVYWWLGMIHDIEKFLMKCQNCQIFNYEHQRPARFLQNCQFRNRSGKG